MKNTLKIKNGYKYLFYFLFSSAISLAQVGVGTYQQSTDSYIYRTDAAPRRDFVIEKESIRMNYNPPTNKSKKNGGLTILTDCDVTTNGYSESSENKNNLVDLSSLYKEPSLGGPGGLRLNIYYPKLLSGKQTQQAPLPLIIYGYGCGFMSLWTGCQDAQEFQGKTPEWFAKKGYIVIVPEYRVGLNIYDRKLGKRSVWKGIQDIRKVIRFCRLSSRLKNTRYRVDTSKPITYLGYSAGAIAGLCNVFYNNQDKELAMGEGYTYTANSPNGSSRKRYNSYDLGSLDDVSGDRSANADFDGKPTDTNTDLNVQDITVSISGGVGGLDVLSRSKLKALFMIQHRLDGVVPCGDAPYNAPKEVFRGVKIYDRPFYQYPFLFGSCSINNYFINNNDKKPLVYKYKYIDKNCNSIDCLKGDAGSMYGDSSDFMKRFYSKTFYHKPIDYDTKTNGVDSDAEVVLKEILRFLLDDCANVTATPIPTDLQTTATFNKSATPDANTIENTDGKEITIYPNPVTGDIMTITATDEDTPYTIYNMLGQAVGSGKVENGTIAVANLSQGNYILKVSTKEQDVVKQFIKQ
jgi:hypothetical protein